MTIITNEALQIAHIVQGKTIWGNHLEHNSAVGEKFTTPTLNLDALIRPRSEPGPAFDLPLSEILDFLEETGKRLEFGKNQYLAEAVDSMAKASPLSRRIIQNCYGMLAGSFNREALAFQAEHEVGISLLDGWQSVDAPIGLPGSIRAFPPRVIHVMAGNAPMVAAKTIALGALTKGIHLLKLPSNDLFTATAILRTMADIDPDHPTLRSFSAAYWKGGDVSVEDMLYRPQYFDKVVVWGGESAIRHALRYAGPGFEIVQYDPKMSISLIGHEAFADPRTLRSVATLAASDSALFNQDACSASLYHFVEGDEAQVDEYCGLVAEELAIDRHLADGTAWTTPPEIRDAVEVLRFLDFEYRVWGRYDGSGLVVRSSSPVDFHPSAKTVNVIPVEALASTIRHVTVATQTIGVFPSARKVDLRDLLAAAGAQRIVSLGLARNGSPGLAHDGHMPLHRLVRWVNDEGA